MIRVSEIVLESNIKDLFMSAEIKQSAAGGVGFGVGSAIGGGLVRAIF